MLSSTWDRELAKDLAQEVEICTGDRAKRSPRCAASLPSRATGNFCRPQRARVKNRRRRAELGRSRDTLLRAREAGSIRHAFPERSLPGRAPRPRRPLRSAAGRPAGARGQRIRKRARTRRSSARAHRIAAEAILKTTVRLVNRASPDKAANTDIQVARKLWVLTAGELKHAEDHMLLLGRKNAMEGRDLPARDGHPAPRPPA